MTITWNDQANTKLLFAILSTSNAKLDCDAIAKIMGNGCTPVAIRRRVAKIVAQEKGANAKADGDADEDPPSSRGRPKSSQKSAKAAKSAPKKRKSPSEPSAASDVHESDDDDEEEEEVIPKKRVRRAPAKVD